MDSSIVSFKSFERKSGPDIKILESITRAAFSQRRKKIRTSLKNIIGEIDLAERLNIDVDLRAEQLSVNEYLKISEYIEKLS